MVVIYYNWNSIPSYPCYFFLRAVAEDPITTFRASCLTNTTWAPESIRTNPISSFNCSHAIYISYTPSSTFTFEPTLSESLPFSNLPWFFLFFGVGDYYHPIIFYISCILVTPPFPRTLLAPAWRNVFLWINHSWPGFLLYLYYSFFFCNHIDFPQPALTVLPALPAVSMFEPTVTSFIPHSSAYTKIYLISTIRSHVTSFLTSKTVFVLYSISCLF